MKVVALNSGRANSVERIVALGARPATSLTELLSEADFISVTCRPSVETVGMLDARAFCSMKLGCVIVNTASAEIFEKSALFAELTRETSIEDRRTIVLDMPYGGGRSESAFRQDPDNEILKELGVVFTPRIAGYTQESCLRGHRIVAEGLREFFNLPRLPTGVPTLDEVIMLAKQSTALALVFRENGLLVTYKPNGSPSTNADLACEELIRRSLKDLGYVFDSACEEAESERAPTACDVEVVIDAIDGTRNFRDGNYGWCSSIAVLKAGKTVLGVVYDPVANFIYAAAVGTEPFIEVNGARIPLRIPDKIPSDFSYSIGSFFVGGTSAAKEQLSEGIKCLGGRGREWGSVALSVCAVARGGLGAFVQANSYRYDHAAAVFIAESAGARVITTGDIHALRTDIIVCHPSLAEQVKTLFQEATHVRAT